MLQFCQLLKNGNIVVAVSTISKIILQCSSSVYAVIAHKFELSNEYEATARHFSRDQRLLLVFEKLTHASIAIIDIHTGFTIGNVHKSVRYGELSKWLMSRPMSGAMATIQYIKSVCIQHYRILNDK